MSNTSYSFKENSHVIVNQGGEKKVMKKILSVALSTAMAFSMFASVAFGADAKLTPEQQFNALKEAGIVSGFPDGLSHLERTLTRAELAKIIVNSLSLEPVDATSYNDKNYANHWGRPYIEAATQAGILNGKDAVKKLFDPNGAVTVQELAKVLVTALKLEVPADANNTASEWAKGYVAAAVNAGYLADGINYQAQATRSQAVVAAYAIYEAAQFKVTKAEAIDATHVKLTLSNGETVDVTLEKALEPNKATELEYTTADGKVLKYTVTYVLTTATKVESVKADNLREVKVAFDGEVDAATAEDADNYEIESDEGRAVDVIGASLSSDKKVVTLTVEDAAGTDAGMTNQKEYKLTVTNVRAGSAVITADEVAFTPVDAALPVAESAQALGNKAIKITFSEPVVKATDANSFTIDGVTAVGTVDVSGSSVILKQYTTLANGEHTIKVSNVKDYSGLANIETELKFNVVEDTTAPTIASVESASFEYVTLKFSEVIDPSTVAAGNVYWKQGTTQRTADTFEQVSDDTYKFHFTGDNKLVYSTSVYVNDVADYSGNVIAKDSSITVNPVVDQTRPEVVSAKLDENSADTLKIKFTKVLDKDTAEDSANYVIKNSKGEEVSTYKEATLDSTGKVVTVFLYNDLDENETYTLTISNVADDTTLKNVIVPYTATIKVGEVSAPHLQAVNKSTTAHRLVVTFDKKMGASATDKANYLYYYGASATATTNADGSVTVNGGEWKTLPSGASMSFTSDGKSVVIVFPSSVNIDDIKAVRVSNVKSEGGKTLSGLFADAEVGSATTLTLGDAPKATATNKIEVDFNATLQSGAVSTSEFRVQAGAVVLSVVSAQVDDDAVVLTLSDKNKLDADGTYEGVPVTVTVLANKNLTTPAGAKVIADATQTVVDGIKPELKNVDRNAVYDGTSVTQVVYFSEDIVLGANGVYDFDVKVDGKTAKAGIDFIVNETSAGVVEVVVTPGATGGAITSIPVGKTIEVRINPSARFITDASGSNVVSGSNTFRGSLIVQP